METRAGDKVRIKRGEHRGARGTIIAIDTNSGSVEIASDGVVVLASQEDITNYSRAARKAWESQPERRVGRPKGSCHCDRTSVTIRVDRELWDRFRQYEAEGRIRERTRTINRWLREMLDRVGLEREQNDAATDD